MKKVVVLGGGFAGIQSAIELQKSGLFEVTLVSNKDYLYIYPITIWIPTHEIEPEEAMLPLAQIQKKYPFNLKIAKILGINAGSNEVLLENGSITYDYLIVSIGADKMQHKGLENTYTICGTPESNLGFRDELDKLIAKGEGKIAIGFGGNPKDKSAVRGGPAFELIFNIDNYLRKKGIRKNFELNMFAPMEEPGARMGKQAMSMMGAMFKSKGLVRYFGKKITGFEPDGVLFEDGSKLASDLTMFIPAGSGSSVFTNSDLVLSEAGFIQINDWCQVKGMTNVFAIGDSAALEGPDYTAKQGHLAELMGRNAAHNIIQIERGTSDFKGYQEHINILCVMDTGNAAAYVYRDSKRAFAIPMPIVGHWMKKAWGYYAKWSKTGKFPRIF